jgi:hypothetical protein
MVKKIKVIRENTGIHIKMDDYIHYLERELVNFPNGAASLCWPITDNYHWNGSRFRHDALILCIRVEEKMQPDSPEHLRKISVQIDFQMQNGSYASFVYIGVKRYLIRKKKTVWPLSSQTHGSIIIDEIRLGDAQSVIHEFVCHDSRLLIECDDINAIFTDVEELIPA